MKLKKIAAMLMAGVMCIGLMAGCGSRSSETGSQTFATLSRVAITTAGSW